MARTARLQPLTFSALVCLLLFEAIALCDPAKIQNFPSALKRVSRSLMREILVSNTHRRMKLNRAARAALVRAIGVLDANRDKFSGGCPDGELSLVFLTDAALAKLHAAFLDDPTTTDVITFEGDPSAGIAGEVCVSVDTAARYAKEHGNRFAEELMLYIVHGWLHLAGYDDLQPAKKRKMRAAEARAMKLLRAADVFCSANFTPALMPERK